MKDTLSTLDLHEKPGQRVTWLQYVLKKDVEAKQAKGWTLADEGGPKIPNHWSRIMERPEPYRG